jgi:hypothetical protein
MSDDELEAFSEILSGVSQVSLARALEQVRLAAHGVEIPEERISDLGMPEDATELLSVMRETAFEGELSKAEADEILQR